MTDTKPKAEPAAGNGETAPAVMPPVAPIPVPPTPPEPPLPPRRRRTTPWTRILSFVAALVALTALVAAAWSYGEQRRALTQLHTEIAQLRLSLDLYAQRDEAAPSAQPPADDPALDDLANRVSILEESWRGAATASPAPAAVPSATPPATAVAGDCLPTSTRFMVASGDSYPVCGTGAVVSIGTVDNGFITLGDGTTIAQGGTVGLPNSACMIAVLPGEGLSGYAEVRVTC